MTTPIIFQTVAGITPLKPGLYKVALPGFSQAQFDRIERGWTQTIIDLEARNTRRFGAGPFWQGFMGGGFKAHFPRSNYINPATGADVPATPNAFFPRKGYDAARQVYWCLVFVKSVEKGAEAQHLVTQLVAAIDLQSTQALPQYGKPAGGNPMVYRYTGVVPAHAAPKPTPVATPKPIVIPKPAPTLPRPAPTVIVQQPVTPGLTLKPKPVTITPPTPTVSIGGAAGPKPTVSPGPTANAPKLVSAPSNNTVAIGAGFVALAFLALGVS